MQEKWVIKAFGFSFKMISFIIFSKLIWISFLLSESLLTKSNRLLKLIVGEKRVSHIDFTAWKLISSWLSSGKIFLTIKLNFGLIRLGTLDKKFSSFSETPSKLISPLLSWYSTPQAAKPLKYSSLFFGSVVLLKLLSIILLTPLGPSCSRKLIQRIPLQILLLHRYILILIL